MSWGLLSPDCQFILPRIAHTVFRTIADIRGPHLGTTVRYALARVSLNRIRLFVAHCSDPQELSWIPWVVMIVVTMQMGAVENWTREQNARYSTKISGLICDRWPSWCYERVSYFFVFNVLHHHLFFIQSNLAVHNICPVIMNFLKWQLFIHPIMYRTKWFMTNNR